MFTNERKMLDRYKRQSKRISEEDVVDALEWVTERDIQILDLLLSSRYLTGEQLEMMVFGNLSPSSWKNKCNQRIKKLYQHHLVDRFFPPVEKNAGTSPQHLTLDTLGFKVLGRYKGYDTRQIKWKKINYLRQAYRHDMKIYDFRALLWLFVYQTANSEILQMKIEHPIRFINRETRKKSVLVPDMFTIIRDSKTSFKIFYVEFDNATEPISTLKAKVDKYINYYQSGEWMNENWARRGLFPAILFLFHTEQIAVEFANYVKTKNTNMRFLCSTYSMLTQDDWKDYVSRRNKTKYVLQERDVRIFDEIWIGKEGITKI